MLYNSTGKFHQLHLDVTHVHVKCMIMPLIIHPWVGKTLLFLVVCLYCCTFKNSKKIKKKKKAVVPVYKEPNYHSYSLAKLL